MILRTSVTVSVKGLASESASRVLKSSGRGRGNSWDISEFILDESADQQNRTRWLEPSDLGQKS